MYKKRSKQIQITIPIVLILIIAIVLTVLQSTQKTKVSSNKPLEFEDIQKATTWHTYENKSQGFTVDYFKVDNAQLSKDVGCKNLGEYPKETTTSDGEIVTSLVPGSPCGPGFSISIIKNRKLNINEMFDEKSSMKCDVKTGLCSELFDGKMIPSVKFTYTKINDRNALIIEPTNEYMGDSDWKSIYIERSTNSLIHMGTGGVSWFDPYIERMVNSLKFTVK